MRYARHVGRVGALAVALGIGVAIATTPGVAWADGTTEDKPAVVDSDTNQAPATPDTTTAVQDPGAAIRNDIERVADDLRAGFRSAMRGAVRSSGGAITSTRRTGSNANNGNVLPAVGEKGTGPESPKDERKSTTVASDNAAANPLQHFTPPRWHAPQPLLRAKPEAKPLANAVDDVENVVQQSINEVTSKQPLEQFATGQRNIISTFKAPTVDDVQVVRPRFVAPIAILTNVVNAALAPFLNPTPGQPAPQNPILWAVLGWVRRQVQDSPFGKFVLNQTPQITTPEVVDNHDGTFTITPSADDFDPDGDTLTYTASDGSEGTVVKNEDGTFTYTVTDLEDWDETDTITLTATDEGSYPHLHGLASLFNPNGGHTDSVMVNVQSSGFLPAPDVTKELEPLDDGSGNWAAEFQYDDTVTEVHAAFDPKYWRVVGESFENGVYRVELEPTELGKLRAGLGLSTGDELVLQVVKDSTVQTMALRTAQVADVDPPEQAYQLPVPPPAHFEVTNPGIQVGSNPAGVVVTDKYAYVANEQDGTVTVVDVNRSDDDPTNPTFNQVVATIPVGSQPFFAGMSGDRLYVVGSDSVSIVDTTSNQTVDTILVPEKFFLIPTNALVSPDGRKLYLLNANDGNVYVIDTDSTHVPDTDPTTPETYKSIIATIPVGSGFTNTGTLTVDFPISGGFSADGTRLYILHESIETNDTVNYTFHDGEVVVIDTTNDAIIGQPIDLEQFGGYAVSDGRYLYVPTFDSAELSAAYPEGAPPGYVTVVDISSDPDHPTVVDLDTSTVDVVDRLRGGALPLNVASSPDKSLAYVVNAGDGTITVIDTVNNVVLDLDPKTTGVQGIQFTPTPADDIYIKNVIGSTPDGTRLYVTNYTTNTVTALEIVDGLAPSSTPEAV